MNTRKICGGLIAASLIGWLLLMPPFSVTPAGKTFVDSGAPLSSWEVFSHHATDAECRKHRDELRIQLDQAVSSAKPSNSKTSDKQHAGKALSKSQEVFATLKARAAVARCVDGNDARLRTPSPAASPKHK
ncbi:MAG: hypothetical protein ACLQU2_21610 [Candidatus Binataceae bacterium]